MKKLKQYILLIATCIFLQNTYSQNCISPEWLINSTGDDWDVVCDMINDKDGSTYLAGNFTASTKLNENSTKLTGDNNIFISKFNAKAENVWLRQIKCNDYCYISSISTDLSGSIYTCGNFKGEINTGEQTLISGKSKNAFIIKMDNKGDFVWSKQINGKFSNNKLFLKNDSEDNLIFAGSFTGILNIDSTTCQSKYFTDILIAKFNDKGELITLKVFEGKANDLINDIAINNKNEIFLTGSFEKELTVSDNVLKSQGRKDAFLIKLNNKLQVIFSKQIGGIYDDYGQNISIDSKDNILLAGSFSDEIQLDKENYLISNGLLDVFLIKYDNNCKIIWAESFGGFSNDYQSSIAINASNNIYLAGTFRGEIHKKDSRINSSNFSNDIFLAKYDANGYFRFIESFGDTNTDFGEKLIIDNANYIYLTGNFTRFLKIIEEETKNAKEEDFFLSKLYDCDAAIKICLPADTSLCGESFIIVADSNFMEYSWNGRPGSNELKIDSTGIYTIEAIDKHHCISRDTIFVQLNNPPLVDLGGPYILTWGETITLYALDGMKEYLWSDNSTLSFLDINTAQKDPGEYLYWVEVTDENECVSADEVLIEVVENKILVSDALDNENIQKLEVYVYPNPAHEQISIRFENLKQNDKIELQIISVTGGVVLWKKVENLHTTDEIVLRLDNILPGTYILIVNNPDFIKRFNIVLL
jgi:hypothetical protein